jgi:RNA polymerase sigma-70 factor (ECF subfamily)
VTRSEASSASASASASGTIRAVGKPATGRLDFDDVFSEHSDYVIRSLERLGVRRRDLEDVAQDVFVALHGRLEGYEAGRPIRPWLFAFAFRAAGNYRRLARNRREDVDRMGTELEPRNDGSSSPEDEVLRAEQRSLLLAALEALDLEHRAAIVLVDIDGASPRDAADALGIPVNTIYSRVRNGRRKLREAIETMADGRGGRR